MKKVLFIVVALCMASYVNAQVYVGGGISFNRVTEGDNKSTAFMIGPEVGYKINDRWAVGLALGYSKIKNSTEVEGMESDMKQSRFTINPYARFTFAKIDRVGLFVDGGVNYSHIDSSGSYDMNGWAVGLRPGISLAVNDKFSLVAHVGFLGYRTQKADYANAVSSNIFAVEIDGSDLSFSVYYNF